MNTYKYINKPLVLLTRYAKEKSVKRIKCTVSSEGNRSREGTKTRAESRRCKEDSQRIGDRIRTRQGNILQSQRCKENPQEHWVGIH